MDSTLISLTVILIIGLVGWGSAELVRWLAPKFAVDMPAPSRRDNEESRLISPFVLVSAGVRMALPRLVL